LISPKSLLEPETFYCFFPTLNTPQATLVSGRYLGSCFSFLSTYNRQGKQISNRPISRLDQDIVPEDKIIRISNKLTGTTPPQRFYREGGGASGRTRVRRPFDQWRANRKYNREPVPDQLRDAAVERSRRYPPSLLRRVLKIQLCRLMPKAKDCFGPVDHRIRTNPVRPIRFRHIAESDSVGYLACKLPSNFRDFTWSKFSGHNLLPLVLKDQKLFLPLAGRAPLTNGSIQQESTARASKVQAL
jgi:hypothetical protein